MLINERLKEEKMTELEESIAAFFLEKEEAIKELSARTIAHSLYTAPSTIIRFCQKLGFKGFNDFKEAYLAGLEYLRVHFTEIDPNQPFSTKDRNVNIANKLGALYQETVTDTLSLLNHDALQAAMRLLIDCDTIYVCSVGDMLELGRTFRNRMIKIGRKVIVDERSDNLFYWASYASEKDCFIMLSYSGETERMLRVAKKLKDRNVPTLAITSYGENSLSRLSTQTLYLSTREKLVDNVGNFSAMISLSLLMDALYSCIFNEDFEKNKANKTKYSYENELYRTSNNPVLNDRDQ